MYPRVPWELVADRLGSAEHTLGTAGLYPFHLPNQLSDSPETYERCGSGAKPNTIFFFIFQNQKPHGGRFKF